MAGITLSSDVELLRDFVNTRELVAGAEDKDLFTTGADVGAWFRARQMALDDLDDPGLDAVRGFRESLRALFETNNGHPVDPDALTRLNRATEPARLRVRLDGEGRPELRPAAPGVPGALAALCAAMVRAAEVGDWSRLKACRDGECRWAFYDTSKNGSKTWCSMEVCGARAKMRSYRARQRLTPA